MEDRLISGGDLAILVSFTLVMAPGNERLTEAIFGALASGKWMKFWAHLSAVIMACSFWIFGMYIPGFSAWNALPLPVAALWGLVLVGPISAVIHPWMKQLMPWWQVQQGASSPFDFGAHPDYMGTLAEQTRELRARLAALEDAQSGADIDDSVNIDDLKNLNAAVQLQHTRGL